MNKKILIIDDDTRLAENLKEKLEAEHYRVITAYDGEDGLQKALGQKPDLIILDIVMPKLNGHEFLAKLKQDFSMRSVPVIAITRYEGLLKFMESEGVKDYLLKPIIARELIVKVKRCLGETKEKKILIIDDEVDVVEALKARLVVNGYEVTVAFDGKESFEKVRTEAPDLIVLNGIMPGMDGYEFLKVMKKASSTSTIPILILIPKGSMRDSFEAFGADGVVSKPFDVAEAVSKVNFLLKNKALVLCDDDDILERITGVLLSRNLETQVFKDEEIALEKAREVKFKVIIVYIPSVKKQPIEFVSCIRTPRNKNAFLIVYSNPKVKGTERNSVPVIHEIKNKWLVAGVDLFFDLRISEKDFPALLESCLF